MTTDRWSWSEGIYTMQGYAPNDIPATTQVLLSHKHPDDRARALSVLEEAFETGEPFSCYHRIIDQNERVRSILSVGHGIKGTDGRVARVEGYFVDLTKYDATRPRLRSRPLSPGSLSTKKPSTRSRA